MTTVIAGMALYDSETKKIGKTLIACADHYELLGEAVKANK